MLAIPVYFSGILEKKNHWTRLVVEDEEKGSWPTKTSEEWSISVEVWLSPGVRFGMEAMPKKQLYSAVMPENH